MKNKNVKVIDQHNIDRNANVMFALELEGSEYVVYWIERDVESNNLFVSKVLRNIDGTYNMLNIDDDNKKKEIGEIIKTLISTSISDQNDKLSGTETTLANGKVVKFVGVSFNKEQHMDIEKTYITTVKKEVTMVAEKYYDVILETPKVEEAAPVVTPVMEPIKEVIPESTPAVVEPITVAQPTVVPAPVVTESVVAAPVASEPVNVEPTVIVPTPVVSEPVVAPELVLPSIPEPAPVVVDPITVAQPTVVPAPVVSEPVVAPVVETPTVEPAVVMPTPAPVAAEPVVVAPVVSEPIVEQSKVEPVVVAPTPVVPEPIPEIVAQPLVFNAAKEKNLNAALGEVASSTTIPVENIEPVREFGVDEPVQKTVEQPAPAIAPMVQPEVSSAPNVLTKKAGFANSKFFMVVAVAFFLASCVFLGYEVFNYFQLIK